jgi:predicted ATPase/DNA-binding CsgD family transcriptional regulator
MPYGRPDNEFDSFQGGPVCSHLRWGQRTRMVGDGVAGRLTRREREVAELVAKGLTDREIGLRLFISKRTVENHVQNVRGRLGFDNRTQIAGWVVEQQYGSGPPAEAAAASSSPPPHNLPAELTTFVGRRWDLRMAGQLLQRGRLLTIAGPGGCGKTRLAVQVGHELLAQFAGGVWFIGLGSISDPDTIPREIAAALGVREREGLSVIDAITRELGASAPRQQTLLLLDNCEHLASHCAEIVDTLLRASPRIKFLCTSREPLHVPGEATWRVEPLPLPEPSRPLSPATLLDSEAVRLFLDRACLHEPRFALDNSNHLEVAELCEQLDGIPLALELAAAYVALMPLTGITKLLERRVRGHAHGVPSRHRTMATAIDWSYELLSDAERRCLRRISVFRGGFTADAADALQGDRSEPGATSTLETLTGLVDKSLVQAVLPRRDRYRCLELIRRDAWRRLAEEGELEDARARHHAYYLGLAEDAAAELTGPALPEWLERLGEEHDNLRAALEFGRDGDAGEQMRLVLALYRFWYIRGHLSEGRAWAEAALAAAPAEVTPLRTKVLIVAANLAWQQGDLPRAQAWYEEGLKAWRTLGDTRGIQLALGNVGLLAWTRGDAPTARALYDQSLALARVNGDARETCIVLINRGMLAACTGELQLGHATLGEALELTWTLGDAALRAAVLANLGTLALEEERDAEAIDHYVESLRLQRSLGARGSSTDCFIGLAFLAAKHGRMDRAVRLAGAASGIRESVGEVGEPWSQHLLEGWLDEARERLGPSAGETWQAGRELTHDEAIAFALDDA